MNTGMFSLLTLVIVGDLLKTTLPHSASSNGAILRRHKRKLPLLFNDFGVSQFVCGFGIPVDLDLETVTTGVVFKSQLPLPATPNDLRNYTTHNVNGRFINDAVDRKLNRHIRWNLYKALELLASNIGLNGRDYVLKALCEANQIPFSDETGDVWHDLVQILFAPFSSVDEVNHHENNEYLAAAKIGLTINHSCDRVFKKCPESLLNMFSNLH